MKGGGGEGVESKSVCGGGGEVGGFVLEMGGGGEGRERERERESSVKNTAPLLYVIRSTC